MAPYAGRRIFRTSPWLLALLATADLLFVAGACVLYRQDGPALMTLGLGVLTVVGAVGLLDALTRRVVLERDALRVTGLWARRSYERREILGVRQEKGTSPSLKLADGGWAKLPPDVGRSIGNSIRAWLKADP